MLQLGQRGYDFFRDIHPATSPISRLWRHTLCLKTRRVTQRLLCPRAAEFPAINPAVSGAPLRSCTCRKGVVYFQGWSCVLQAWCRRLDTM